MSTSILVVDDDQRMLRLYARIFKGSRYSITLAASFTEASGLIAANHYDLLVTDFMFPDGRGTELINLFEDKRAGAKSLMVTGSGPVDGIMIRDGITEYLEKPVKVKTFMAAVKRMLDAQRPN